MVSNPAEASINFHQALQDPRHKRIANKPLILLDFSRGGIMTLLSLVTDDRAEPKL
jgi:hypothetical protein